MTTKTNTFTKPRKAKINLGPTVPKAARRAKAKLDPSRHDVGPIDCGPIEYAMMIQGAVHPRAIASFDPQIQFILSNRFYAEAALAAIKVGKVVSACITDTGIGGYSCEIMATRDTVSAMIEKYNEECDRMGLY